MLLLAALCCVTVAHFRLRREYTAVAFERGRLRDQLGHIDIHDPKIGYIRRARTDTRLMWKNRVYLPDGSYSMVIKSGRFTDYSPDKNSACRAVRSGESTVAVSLRQNEAGRWGIQVKTTGYAAWHEIDQAAGERLSLEDPSSLFPSYGPQESFATDRPKFLLRQVDHQTDGSQFGVVVYIATHKAIARLGKPDVVE